MIWKTARREININRPLVMGILNVTPDSFSDGGRWAETDAALSHAESMVEAGADIIDIGGQSTRPGSKLVDPEVELNRTLPVVAAIAKRFDIPLSIDTFHWLVAKAALDNGAEIINDISGLRWDARIADAAHQSGAGLILMHSRGEFATMHSLPPVENIIADVCAGLASAIETAQKWGVGLEQIALDIGLGFGKTFEQNLELLAKLDKIVNKFNGCPVLVGASRKSFIGKLTGERNPAERLGASLAAAMAAAKNGAKVLRVHDVAATVQALRLAAAIEARET